MLGLLIPGVGMGGGVVVVLVYGPLSVSACEIYIPGAKAVEPYSPGLSVIEPYIPGASAVEAVPI